MNQRSLCLLPAGRRVWLLLGAALASTAGCLEPRTSVANLEELYSARPREAETPAPKAITEVAANRAGLIEETTGIWTTEVTERDGLDVAWQDLKGLFVEPDPQHPDPDADRETLENPVEFGLENLAELQLAYSSDLDLADRARAIAMVTEIARIDPSRIVRERAFETAATLFNALPKSDYRFSTQAGGAEVDARLDQEIELLSQVADASRELRDELVAARGADLIRATQALGAARPAGRARSQQLLLLGAKCGRQVARARGEPAVAKALVDALIALSAHTCFLAAQPDVTKWKGAADIAEGVRGPAGRLLVTVDPVGASLILGEVYPRIPQALVRVAWLQAFAAANVAPRALHPSLRRAFADDLDFEDAAVAFWARECIVTRLGADPKTTIDVLRAQWLALGEWDAAAPHS